MPSRLPRPLGRQKEVLALPAGGHTVVLGTAGSGKTTLAILRAAYLADETTDHGGRTLLVTFNNTLVTYMRSMHNLPRLVTTETYHKFARGYLARRSKMGFNCIAGPQDREALAEQAMAARLATGDADPILRRSTRFMAEEFRWLAQHGIGTSGEYVAAERVGRAGTRVPRSSRPSVFACYEDYQRRRAPLGYQYDWDDMAQTVAAEFDADDGERRYRHVVIDEGQDLSPMMLRSLAAAVPDHGSLTFFGDMAQQIYGNRMSWKDAGLTVRGGVWRFQENYRNTRQIAKVALALAEMPFFKGYPDLVAPNSPTADGPTPMLVTFKSEDDEIARMARFAARAAKGGRSVAILFRDRAVEALLTPHLPSGAIRLHKSLQRWPGSSGLFYGTYHSAKGLEFDAVYVPFCSAGRLPHPPEVDAFGADAASGDGRLLYVAITRAKTDLVLSHSGPVSTLLPTDPTLFARTAL